MFKSVYRKEVLNRRQDLALLFLSNCDCHARGIESTPDAVVVMVG